MATIRHQLWIDAPIQDVYAALSTPDGVSMWWNDQRAVDIDGGVAYEHDPQPVGEHGTVRLAVRQQIPNQCVEWECVSTHKDGVPAAGWTGTTMIFRVRTRDTVPAANEPWARDIPAQTILDFRHENYDADNPYHAFCSAAWACVLDNLKSTVEATNVEM